MELTDTIFDLIGKLTGQECPLSGRKVPKIAAELLGDPERGIGHGQFNELLLTLGYDRVSHSFFQYLVDGKTKYKSGAAFRTLDELRAGVDRFRKLSMLLYGNVKFGFKRLSPDQDELLRALSFLVKRSKQSFKDRHLPIHPIERISGERTYYLGYFIRDELRRRLDENPQDPVAIQEEKIRQETVEIGKRNHEAYLVSDHLDVYVATSMRERHEYQMVHKLTHDIFMHPVLKDLQLRYFDPTQSYCTDREDKGLAEALMLKRAKCTIYFAQESDTLGKDSELASTLAQGKPVIAYVPDPPSDYAEKLLDELKLAYPTKEKRELLLEQLRLFASEAAWKDREVREWIEAADTYDVTVATKRLQQAINQHYDRRAKTLRVTHPLGIQVNLNTGVANGVLVVRQVDHCAELVRRVVQGELELEIEEGDKNGMKYLYLKEKLSNCIFRVVTGDKMLTNSFWNFYLLNPIEQAEPSYTDDE